MYLKKLGLEGLPPACYDPCRSRQAISRMEAGVGGCTAQQAVDLAHTEIRIQLTILRKLLTVMKMYNICRCSSNLYKHIKIRIKNIPGDWDETCVPKLGLKMCTGGSRGLAPGEL